VISGNDLTTEAALTKLMFLLANEVDKRKLVEELNFSICGELTVNLSK
jgi:L-asparaginase